ncbi:molybdate ABC transporter substrate-binding protein [Corynebacterium bovis]|uniref:molybdate ABC transporter substrate-binding protein n=4 Tax=Corynebacterium bovis TaxID=36808 RepID=UPI000F6518C4|nr:molybdate ABC transporter substrate-binding protein [Corynebacterium bovis]RRO90095.1 molybdate ABC transporter substrate-binding protein [Corynebacterium bovis]RRQ17038.1 molybdate ABC transporter substrate-binding protein [Corynebacterium bovis]
MAEDRSAAPSTAPAAPAAAAAALAGAASPVRAGRGRPGRAVATGVAAVAAAVGLVAGVTACASSPQDEPGAVGASTAAGSTARTGGAADPDQGDAATGTATVFAAASLRPVGDSLVAAFRAAHPDAQVEMNYGGSSALVRQIDDGAPADLFISADRRTMDTALTRRDFSGADPVDVASNRLVLAVPRGNPGHVTAVRDLPGHRVAVCAREVPCGDLAGKALADAGVTLDDPSEEANVSAVATKVSTGQVDAGFIYSTDARALADEGVTATDIPGVEANVYPAALTTRGRDNATARAFRDWMRGPEAQRILADHGFSPAPAPSDSAAPSDAPAGR